VRRRLNPGLFLVAPVVVLLLLLFLAPLAVLVPTSVHPYDPTRGIQPGLTLANYATVLLDSFYLEILLRTIGMGLMVAAICLVICWPYATLIVRASPRLKAMLILIIIFPMMIDVVVRSFGWIVLLANRGLVNDALIAVGLIDTPIKLIFAFSGLVIGMVHLMFPFMTLLLAAAIKSIPPDVENASATLGSSPAATFFHVTLPLAMPGVMAGSVLVFVLSISAMITPRLLGGPTYRVMATTIADEFLQLLNWPVGAALSIVLTVLVLALVGLSGRLTRKWAMR
jgi:putative spermidine/putrescine transport system permease protein